MPSTLNLHTAVTILGLTIGLGVSYLSRPAVLGIQIPIEIVTSTAAADAPFRQQLAIHLGVATAIGGAIGMLIGIILGRGR